MLNPLKARKIAKVQERLAKASKDYDAAIRLQRVSPKHGAAHCRYRKQVAALNADILQARVDLAQLGAL